MSLHLLCPGIERFEGWSVVCRFQQAQGGKDHGSLPLTAVRQAEGATHEMRRDEGARRFEQLRIRAKGLDIDAYRWDANRFNSARDVTHGHVADGSARGQENGVYAIIFEHLCPLRGALLH